MRGPARCRQQARFPAASRLLALSAALSLALSGGLAQAPQPSQNPEGESIRGAVLKGRAPVNKEILSVTLPKAQEATLGNGLRVIVLESHKLPTFSMQMVIPSGGLSDPADQRGLASFTASLLEEGTARRSSREIAEQVESLGASLSAGSGLSSFTTDITVSGLVENLDSILDIFADVILQPAFPGEELEKFKTRTLSQLQYQKSLPQFVARERFSRAVYRDHPAGLVVPPEEAIRKTGRENLAAFHRQHYRPGNAMLAVVGDVTLKELLPKVRKYFGNWQSGPVRPAHIPPAPTAEPSRIHLVHRSGSVQTVLLLGNLGIERTSPDYFPLLVMDQIVGGGPAARLFMNLREEKGYTYGAYSSFTASKFAGVWTAGADVRSEVTEGAMSEFMKEFKRIREELVSPEELENAKRALIGNFALSLESPRNLLANILTQKLYGLPSDYWDTYPRNVASVTAQQVRQVAGKYVNLERMQIVAVGDASKVRPALEKFGPVEVHEIDAGVTAP